MQGTRLIGAWSCRLAIAALILVTWMPGAARPAHAATECAEPNDEVSGACPIQPGDVAEGILDHDGDRDVWKLTVSVARPQMELRLACPTMDCDLYLGRLDAS